MNRFFRQCMMERQVDGKYKYSWFRMLGLLWFWLGLLPVVYASLFFGVDFVDEKIVELTGIFVLGITSSKGFAMLAGGKRDEV